MSVNARERDVKATAKRRPPQPGIPTRHSSAPSQHSAAIVKETLNGSGALDADQWKARFEKSIDWAVMHFENGMKKGRDMIIKALATSAGRRSRSLKGGLAAGTEGAERCADLKSRGQALKKMKARDRQGSLFSWGKKKNKVENPYESEAWERVKDDPEAARAYMINKALKESFL